MNFSDMKTLCAIALIFSSAGCSQYDMPKVFHGNEVPPEVIVEPRVVETPVAGEAEKQPWMRLGDVPSKPKDFTSPTLIEQTRQEMIYERNQADVAKDAVDNPSPIIQP